MRVHKDTDGAYHIFTDFTLYTEKMVDIPEFLQRKFGLTFDQVMSMDEAFPGAQSRRKVRAYAWFQDLYETPEGMEGTVVSVYSTVRSYRPIATFIRDDTALPAPLEARMMSPQGQKGIITLDEELYAMMEEDNDLGFLDHDSIALLAYTEGKPVHITTIEQYTHGPLEMAAVRSPYWEPMAELANLLSSSYDGLLFDGVHWVDRISPGSLDDLEESMLGQVARKESVRKTGHRFVLAGQS